MPLTDQQLRQELVNFGENVPPITQRNREQLRARLEILRARPRSPVKSASTHARSPASSARSRPSRGLIEFSDSDTDTPSSNYHRPSRSPGRANNVQIRSVATGRDTDRGAPISSTNVTSDVEQSIARHRREIQQLIDSARDRSRVGNTNISSSKYEPIGTTPLRPSSNGSRSRQVTKTDLGRAKQPSWFKRTGDAIQSFWKVNQDMIVKALKALLLGALLGGGLIFLASKGSDLIPHRKGITCTPDDATECDEMVPLVGSLLRYLRIRAGESDCKFRPDSDRYLTRPDINKYLDEKGFKFEDGTDTRWNTLIAYLLEKPVEEISVLDSQNQLTSDLDKAFKLTAKEGIHSLVCRARKSVNSAMKHIAWIVLGTAGFLGLGWLLKHRSEKQTESENTFKEFVEKITNLLQDQHEEHLSDSETKPWLAISHIRDMLIAPQDRQRLKALWDRAVKQISEKESRVRSESQLIHGEEFDVWRWIQPRSPSPVRKKRAESPHSSNEESYVYMPPDVGLTQCLKLRHFFDPDTIPDDDEIDLVVDSIQNRCATIRRIEHIGINALYVYLKLSSKEAAAQGFHLLNNWKFHGREIVAKYLRLERYHEHFPEARDIGVTNN